MYHKEHTKDMVAISLCSRGQRLTCGARDHQPLNLPPVRGGKYKCCVWMTRLRNEPTRVRYYTTRWQLVNRSVCLIRERLKDADPLPLKVEY